MNPHPREPFTRWPTVEGYCWPHSYHPGDRIEMRCASRGERFSAIATRVGATRDVVWQADGLTSEDPATGPDPAWSHGCGWPVTFTIETDPTWESGYYEVALVADGQDRSEAFFVLKARPVRSRGRSLLVLATNTYAAYNQWGGRCLYSGATRVSFERPLERGYLRRPAAPTEVDFDGRVTNIAPPDNPDPDHLALQAYQAAGPYPLWSASSGWHNWERRFVAWAEGAGFEFDYAVNADLQFDPSVVEGRPLVVSVGHDEYWSWEMRETIDRHVADGGNWAIFSGNTMFWQVRLVDGGQAMVAHKGGARFNDPVVGTDQARRLTSMWSDPWIGWPEDASTGLSFTRGGYHRIGQAVADGDGAYLVHRPDHWAFTGTGLAAGDRLGLGSFIVGYEVDGCELDLSDPGQPTSDAVEVLATAPARLISITDEVCEAPAALWASVDPPGDLEGVAMILYGDASEANVARLANGHAVVATSRPQGPDGGLVFHAGSADWAYGLDTDRAVQKVTANVLNHLSARP